MKLWKRPLAAATVLLLASEWAGAAAADDGLVPPPPMAFRNSDAAKDPPPKADSSMKPESPKSEPPSVPELKVDSQVKQAGGLFNRNRPISRFGGGRPLNSTDAEVVGAEGMIGMPPPQLPGGPAPQAPFEQPPTNLDLDGLPPLETSAASSIVAPEMIGDMIGSPFLIQNATRRGVGQSIAMERALRRWKVADNNSPLPQTRVFYDFNYFNNAYAQDGQLFRNGIGGEWSFGHLASIEVRGAVNSLTGFDGPDTTDVADLRTTLKVLLVQTSGYAVSGGLGMSWPTGKKPENSPPGDFILAPFIGYLIANDSNPWFVQGFQQLDVPTDGRDTMVMHTDVGTGYWLRRNSPDRMITAFAPTAELHLYTPIGKRPNGEREGLRYVDTLNATFGATMYFGPATSLSMGFGVPLSAKAEYDLEYQMHFNWRF